MPAQYKPFDHLAQRPGSEGSVALADWTLSGSNQAEIHQALATGVARLMAERAQVIDSEYGQARDIRWSDIAVLGETGNPSLSQPAAFKPGLRPP